MKSLSPDPASVIASNPPRRAVLWHALAWLAFTAALVVLLWPRLLWMYNIWTHDGLYSFCLLVAPTSAFLIWKSRRRLARLRTAGSVLGVCLTVTGIVLTLARDWSGLGLNSLTPSLIIMILAGSIAALYGWAVVRAITFPLLFLLLLMPLPPLLVSVLDYPLQVFCARITASLVQALGIHVQRTGANLYLDNFAIGVAPACNGLRSSFALLALGLLVSYLFEGPWKRKILVILLTVPFVYAANFLRLLVDVLIVQGLGRQFWPYEETWDLTWGFLTFLLASIFLMAVARRLRCAETASIS